MLAPGGILQLRDLVFSFNPSEADARLESWLRTAAAERPEDDWTRAELETHLHTEHSAFTWLLEPMLARAGFDVLSAEYGLAGGYASYVCVKSSP